MGGKNATITVDDNKRRSFIFFFAGSNGYYILITAHDTHTYRLRDGIRSL